MSGHSHWAGIKHKKGAADAKRGRLFSKLSKNIMIAVRDGGPDPDTNLQLKYAIAKAKEASMPKATIDRAIKKMTGEGTEGVRFEILTYEGYGPGGTAILVESLTDNKNRTSSELRKIFESKGGRMGESGCVSYLFEAKGLIIVSTNTAPEEKIMEIIMDAGAENMVQEGENFQIITSLSSFQSVKSALEKAGITIEESQVAKIPKTTVLLNDETVAKKLLDLLDALEDHEDTNNVYSNEDIPQELMEKLASQQ